MKKFIAIAAVAITLTACNGGNTETTNVTTDSTKVDSTKTDSLEVSDTLIGTNDTNTVVHDPVYEGPTKKAK